MISTSQKCKYSIFKQPGACDATDINSKCRANFLKKRGKKAGGRLFSIGNFS